MNNTAVVFASVNTGGSALSGKELFGDRVETHSVCQIGCMEAAGLVDIEAIQSACEKCDVKRLRIFGEADGDSITSITSRFDISVEQLWCTLAALATLSPPILLHAVLSGIR